mmetsp:Transcript_21721/g.54796  ORF Transcript_21721/g.54796 Transcript_21721/m.54796 type:complete len:209 (-) Transcript_21721:101-727(-)
MSAPHLCVCFVRCGLLPGSGSYVGVTVLYLRCNLQSAPKNCDLPPASASTSWTETAAPSVCRTPSESVQRPAQRCCSVPPHQSGIYERNSGLSSTPYTSRSSAIVCPSRISPAAGPVNHGPVRTPLHQRGCACSRRCGASRVRSSPRPSRLLPSPTETGPARPLASARGTPGTGGTCPRSRQKNPTTAAGSRPERSCQMKRSALRTLR